MKLLRKSNMSNWEKIYSLAFLLSISIITSCGIQNNSPIQKQLFDLNWKFNQGDNNYASEVDFVDQNWRTIDLPHDWSKDLSIKVAADNKADSLSSQIGWYRKQFEIPRNWSDKKITLDFEGISGSYEIFLNGNLISDSQKRDTAIQINLNQYLNSSDDNIIAIRVKVPKQIDGQWEYESGIYNHVWLEIEEDPKFME